MIDHKPGQKVVVARCVLLTSILQLRVQQEISRCSCRVKLIAEAET